MLAELAKYFHLLMIYSTYFLLAIKHIHMLFELIRDVLNNNLTDKIDTWLKQKKIALFFEKFARWHYLILFVFLLRLSTTNEITKNIGTWLLIISVLFEIVHILLRGVVLKGQDSFLLTGTIIGRSKLRKLDSSIWARAIRYLGLWTVAAMLCIIIYASIYYYLVMNFPDCVFNGLSKNISTWWDALYFSVVTQATVGYGDISPVKPIARFFVISQILVGFAIITVWLPFLLNQVFDFQSRTHKPS